MSSKLADCDAKKCPRLPPKPSRKQKHDAERCILEKCRSESIAYAKQKVKALRNRAAQAPAQLRAAAKLENAIKSAAPDAVPIAEVNRIAGGALSFPHV
jgi:hypothetical protein